MLNVILNLLAVHDVMITWDDVIILGSSHIKDPLPSFNYYYLNSIEVMVGVPPPPLTPLVEDVDN